ncbi:hypothetical protein GCM10010193_58450 [Kitasatospora atroaurantiaca]|uniref:Uncharacterized protein n=1 Tax=Kitasatospora atroaurantiaca TaxID=285545 RepID=A0A561EP91_9ACTN|nr:hypothetical protein [Kitasatospora atroaurantiaca]TWE17407.1 hypothetical protein FB465_2428 [Kitasatospora atroaurantiaca]
MATGVPQYRRLAAGGVLPGVAPALVPDGGGGGEPSCLGGGGAAAHPVPTGYDTVTVPVRHGLETVDILRLRRACGAVLQTAGGSAIAFLVPAGTAERWHLPGSTCTAGAVLLPPTDPRWVMPPSGPNNLVRPTDAWVLRSALCEAACTLTAGGLGPF